MEDPPPVVLALGQKGVGDSPDATFFMPGNFAINITPIADDIPGDPTTYYVGKTICVTGEITLSPIEKPEIIVTDISQIEIK